MVPRVSVKADKIGALYAILRDELEFVRGRIKEHYNKYRLKGPRLERGDKVYLILCNIRTNRPSKKLDFKKIGLFKVDKQISDNNYRLLLPVTIRLRTYVFHISLLELVPKIARLTIDIEAEDKEEE